MISFTDLAVRSGMSSIRLHCAIPTWSSPTDTCDDLHDLHELRSRFLLFIHDLLQSLRASGISASYSLTPSNASLGFICEKPINTAAITEGLQKGNLKLTREQAGLVDWNGVPCLILT
ncbi:hypothetical protein CVT26_001516 [Gymnopilus dilepis]|uniref:Uncharacterized protein n=1 Tax=Gymnopilus dilepis TaxID=231916 RepID=A0A409VTL8_9AGAR|nr:hypothetical protein CVT26_001516 [Gymnopilus dilepis]